MGKIAEMMLGILSEIDPDGLKNLGAKQFVQFLENKDVPMEAKVSSLFSLDMDDLIAHLNDDDKARLAESVQRLHKCGNWYLNRLHKKIVADDKYANLTREELIEKLKETDNDNKGE